MWAIIILGAAAASAADSGDKFQRGPLANKTSVSGHIDISQARTVMACARRCSKYGECRSLFYVQSTGECQTHSALYTPASLSLIDTISAVYYERGCVPPPFTCPSTNLATFTKYCDVSFSYRVYVDVKRNFADAKAQCIAEGGSLVDILTVEKMNFVRTLIMCPLYSQVDFWVDGEYNDVTSAYETSGGVPLPLTQGTFFYTGKPKTFGPGRAIKTAYNMLHLLDDDLDSGLNYMICERA